VSWLDVLQPGRCDARWALVLMYSAYSCDRDLGMALGRPPAIQDEWVTAAVS